MPTYEYDAKDVRGQDIRVAVEAASREEAEAKVRVMGYAPVGLRADMAAARAAKKPLHLADPPRSVPPLGRLANLFGGFYNQFGWAWVGFTLIFAWVFLPNIDLAAMHEFGGNVNQTPGVVTGYRKTNTSVNETPIYETRYQFTADDGRRYEGASYAAGRWRGAGESVTVEYPHGKPSRSRIQGMSRTVIDMGGWAAVAPLGLAAFISVGAAFLVIGLRNGLRANRLLVTGKPAVGVLKSREPTNVRINNQPVWKLTFAFTADDGQTYEAVAKTHRPEPLVDEAGGEHLLYDPFEPARAAMLDNMPGGVRVDELGQWRLRSAPRAVLWLALPVLVVAVHAVIAYVVWLR